MSSTQSSVGTSATLGFSIKKKARNGDWEARNLFVDIQGKTLVNLRKDTPRKFLSWTDIIHFEQLDYAHLKIQFHSNRDYLLQAVFADDIATLCTLLGLISQWRAATKDRKLIIHNDIEELVRFPVLYSGYVQKLGRYAVNKRWMVAASGR
eukprot:CAMPEP_0198222478 /NCGR_PEP_ID=MMETSP1445-20131203/88244_1 /TAXON_ID=36898 /ORGANISM="Pyramimonas sp., Strain CCMP2087" /LENGTH=150 /DNA_ID=CAMNT_0043900993 /DNA_START=98 /DNA_END=546 /DNA_ORIENTATION=+